MRILDEIGKSLMRLTIIGLVALVVIQGLMTRDSIRFYLSLGEQWEGKPLATPVSAVKDSPRTTIPTVQSAVGTIDVVLTDYAALPEVKVLVNGETAAVFKGRRVRLRVVPGDVVEVDATSYTKPVRFRIEKISQNLEFPRAGMEYTAKQSIVMVGRVIGK